MNAECCVCGETFIDGRRRICPRCRRRERLTRREHLACVISDRFNERDLLEMWRQGLEQNLNEISLVIARHCPHLLFGCRAEIHVLTLTAMEPFTVSPDKQRNP